MRTKTVTYHVNVASVSRRDWFVGRLYHWYDMRIPCRIPGWHRFERWLARHGAEHKHFLGFDHEEGQVRWRDRLYGWTVEQDLRCYHLTSHKETWLGQVELTAEQYLAAGGRPRVTAS